MRPGELVGEADPDAGQARELGAVDVELARDGEVGLPEAALALPREVRVGQQQPAAVGRPVGADRPPVRRRRLARAGATWRWPPGLRPGPPAPAAGRGRCSRRPRRCSPSARPSGRRRRPPPARSVAPRARPRTSRARPPTPTSSRCAFQPVGERGEQLDRPGRCVLPVVGRPLEDADVPPGDVGVDVGVLLARTEPAGALAPDLDDLVGEVAGAVLAAGPPLAERHVGDRVAGDVGHAALGAADDRLVRVASPDDVAPRLVAGGRVSVSARAGHDGDCTRGREARIRRSRRGGPSPTAPSPMGVTVSAGSRPGWRAADSPGTVGGMSRWTAARPARPVGTHRARDRREQRARAPLGRSAGPRRRDRVLIGCRNPEKGAAARDQVAAGATGPEPDLVALDLADLDSVRSCRRGRRRHGRPPRRAHEQRRRDGAPPPPHRTGLRGAVRHQPPRPLRAHRPAAPAAAARRLRRGSSRRRPPPTASAACAGTTSTGERRYGKWLAYGQSKLANLLFTFELDRRAARRRARAARRRGPPRLRGDPPPGGRAGDERQPLHAARDGLATGSSPRPTRWAPSPSCTRRRCRTFAAASTSGPMALRAARPSQAGRHEQGGTQRGRCAPTLGRLGAVDGRRIRLHRGRRVTADSLGCAAPLRCGRNSPRGGR